MSVATAIDNKSNKKPQYKDYVSFLETYKNGKKDDQITIDSGISLSLNNSSNNSSSSIYSDLTEPPKSSFKEYLNHYNSKKYSPVQPPVFNKKENEQQIAEAKTVKTEVFIEINNPLNTVSKVVDIRNAQNVSNVSKVSKIFENKEGQNGNVASKVTVSSGKVNTFSFDQNKSVGAKKFEGNHHKVPLKKANSITEKSKVFEDKVESRKNSVNGCVSPPPVKVESRKTSINSCVSPPPSKVESRKASINSCVSPPPFNVELRKTSINGCVSPPPFQIESKKTPITSCVSPPPVKKFTNNCVSPPPFITKKTTVTQENAVVKTNGSISPKNPITIKPIVVPKALTQALVFQRKEDVTPINQTPANDMKPVAAPKVVVETVNLEKSSNTPPPPPLPSQSFTVDRSNIHQHQTSIPPPPAFQPLQNGAANMPPPPPLPPANFTVKKVENSPPRQKVSLTRRRSDVVDGAQRPTIDKNDPRVKKLVYGALRDMYGTYHDKANDYIATLPRVRVKKNNGLDNIINSIASQGGLEKLNGRINPSVETE